MSKSMSELRLIAIDILEMIKEKKLTIEETFYVLNLVKFFGTYAKIKRDFEKVWMNE